MGKHFDIIPPEPEDLVDLGSDFMFTEKDLEQLILALNWYLDTWVHLTNENRRRVEDMLGKYSFIYSTMNTDKDFEKRWGKDWR